MANEVTTTGFSNLPKSQYTNTELAQIASEGSGLPWLKLCTGRSDACINNEIQMNHYALFQNQVATDVGDKVDVLLLSARPKAVDFNSKQASFDPESDFYKDIVSRMTTPNSGVGAGLEFLVWLPAVKTFAALFMGSSLSTRKTSQMMLAQLEEVVTLSSRTASNEKYTWVTMSVSKCSTPIGLPNEEDVIKQCETFLSPPKSNVVMADSETRER